MHEFRSDPLAAMAERGMLADCSDASRLDSLLAGGKKISVYAGFDPTAGSLHAGLTTAIKGHDQT